MNHKNEMYVINRVGKKELLNPNKITERLIELINRTPIIENVNPYALMVKVTEKLVSGISTSQIDDYIAQLCSSLSITNYNYSVLAARIIIDSHQKNTKRSFIDKMQEAYMNKTKKDYASLIAREYIKYVEKNENAIEKMIDYTRDFAIDYFGFKTFQKLYGLEVNDLAHVNHQINENNLILFDDELADKKNRQNANNVKKLTTADKTRNKFKNLPKKLIERPQDLFMRVAIEIHSYTQSAPNIHETTNASDAGNSDTKLIAYKKECITRELELIKETYDALSLKEISHATPTYFNSGSNNNQLASCFLMDVHDSRKGIKKADSDMAAISTSGGGIGFNMSSVRSEGMPIKSGREAVGIMPYLAGYRWTLRGFNQNGRRSGSGAPYLEMQHPEIMRFLRINVPETEENNMAGELFTGLWICDLFMERMIKDEMWSLFDPTTEDLSRLYGKRFRKRYLELEEAGEYVDQIPARDIWNAVLAALRIKGLPYICFKDNVNIYSNQKNIGIIKNSNLCTEIMEVATPEEYSVCVLGSISLATCVVDTYTEDELGETDTTKRRALNHEFPLHPKFDFEKLQRNTHILVRNLNNIIDKNKYPTQETFRSNMRHRPIGIGVQGLNDAFMKMRYPFDSCEARILNRLIAENINYAAYSMSTKLSREYYEKLKIECKLYGSAKHIKYVPNTHSNVPNNVLDNVPDTQTAPNVHSNVPNVHNNVPNVHNNVPNVHSNVLEYTEVIYERTEDIPKDIGAYPSMKWGTSTRVVNGEELEELPGSPISRGEFHWECYTKNIVDGPLTSQTTNLDWETVREHIKVFGIRNSLTCAYMPTASTSQLLGNNECVEPMTANIYKRRTLAGQFIVINKYMIRDMQRLGIWNDEIRDHLMITGGSVQNIDGLPEELKNLYKTATEIDQKVLVQYAIDRQPFVDQAQSLNLYQTSMNDDYITKLMCMAWHKKLKTGKYYLHTEAPASAQKFTIDPKKEKELSEKIKKIDIGKLAEKENADCLLCSA